MTASKPSVSAIIVNYQAGALILEHLKKLQNALSQYAHAHIYIVDNASPNGDYQLLEQSLAGQGNVTLIDGGDNLGFAKANNIAYEYALKAGTEYILFINPDAYLRPQALSVLVDSLVTRPQAAISGAQLLTETGDNSACNFRFPTVFREFATETGLGFLKKLFGAAPDHRMKKTEPEKAEWVSGAAFLLRTVAAPTLMDGRYFLYFEETDMMLRLSRAGWEIWHCPGAEVVHVGGVSTGVEHGVAATRRLPVYWFESWRLYYVGNHGRFYAVFAAFAKVTGILASYGKHAIKRETVGHPPHYLSDVMRYCLLATLQGK